MSKEKFTQGEWLIGYDNDHAGEYINVGMAQLYNNYHDKEQAAQNAHDAHLITAAPDMYRILDMLEELSAPQEYISNEEFSAICKIKETLAKARGE